MAGKHIIELFEEESPEQYRAILAKLLVKAQEEDDENIVSNHYLQIKAIIKMSHNSGKNFLGIFTVYIFFEIFSIFF